MKRILFALGFGVIMLSSCKKETAKLPNLLFVMMDDLGYGQFAMHNGSLSVEAFDPFFMSLVTERQDYSPEQALEFSRQAMPTLECLAKDGILFTKAFAPSNLCAPSRICIATGKMQQSRGIYRNADVENFGFEPGSLLAEKLKALGYATAHIGKWHIAKRDESMLKKVLEKYNLPEDISYHELRNVEPEAYSELRLAGYYGSVEKKYHPLRNGFDYYYGYNTWASQFYNSTLVWDGYEHAGIQPGYNTDHFTDKALDFIAKQVKKDQPFFVQIHYHAVHDSLQPKAPDAYFSKFPSPSYDLTNFYAHVYGVDFNIRRIVEYLRQHHLFNNTIIVFTSDNGAQAGLSGVMGPSVLPGNAPFRGTKGSYFLGGIRVPLLISWPDGIQAPGIRDQLVSTMDILPTLIDAAGGKVPVDIDGKSMLPLLQTDADIDIHDRLMWAGIHSREFGFNRLKCLNDCIGERNRCPASYVVITDTLLFRFIGNIEPGLYPEYPDGSGPSYELYKYNTDPFEAENLAGSEPEAMELMINDYKDWAHTFQPPIKWNRERWDEISFQ